MSRSRSTAQVVTFESFGVTAVRRTVSINVDGAVRVFTPNDTSAWVETWLAVDGGVDFWVAHRKVEGGYQVEWEASARAPVASVGAFSITVPGLATHTVAVNRQWPAGRRLCGRLGVEFYLWDPWSKPGGYRQRFGPLGVPLPTLPASWDQVSFATTKLAEVRACVAAQAGTCQVDDSTDGITQWDGPWPCWERVDPGPGSPGGSGIFHATGWENCVEYARLCLACEAVGMERMWAYNNADGTPVTVDQYAVGAQPYCNSEANTRLPPFDSGADTLPRPISQSHLTRVMRRVIAAYEMTGSPLARRHILSLAHVGRLMFSERSPLATLELGSGYMAWNLTSYENRSLAVGNNGRLSVLSPNVVWDRNHGWLMWCVAEAKKVGMEWTAGWADWSARLLACFVRNQMPNGILARTNRGDVDAGNSDIAATMHEALLGLGVTALAKRAGINMDAVLNVHAASLYRNALVRGGYYGQVGPLHFFRVGNGAGGTTEPAIVTGWSEPSDPGNPGDPSHVESYLTATRWRTSDTSWLNDSLVFGVPAGSLAAKKAAIEAETFYMTRGWTAMLLAALQ